MLRVLNKAPAFLKDVMANMKGAITRAIEMASLFGFCLACVSTSCNDRLGYEKML